MRKSLFSGDDSFEYQTDNLSTGTYTVAITSDTGEIENVSEILITNTTIETTVPTSVTAGSRVTLAANTTPNLNHSGSTAVFFLVEHNGTWTRIPAQRDTDGNYTATTELHARGGYRVQPVIRRVRANNTSERVGLGDLSYRSQ